MSTVFDYLKEHLNGGKSADDIAALLREKGVKGYRGNSQNCPIAALLTRELGLTVKVGSNSVGVLEAGLCEWSPTCKLTHNKTVENHYLEGEDWEGFAEFVNRFDGGEFSDLDAEAVA